VIGPMKPPKGVNGLILRHGYIVAEFGDTREVEVTASLTKSILATVAGVTFDRGLIPDLDEPVGARVKDGGYASPHNARITWRHHLQQTSEWEGELWGMTDVNDRRGELRALPAVEPGTRFGYNDVRVNRLALSLLRLWNRPLPDVLREEVMDPIGASRTWEWHGYRTSWVTLPDGRRVQSVSGGAHWGGGFWSNAYDLARLGLLYQRGGRWRDRQVLSREWIRLATTPSPRNPRYGFLFWLNSDGRFGSGASRAAFSMNGGGGHYCFVDPENGIVIAVKSLGGGADGLAEFVNRVMAAVER
jgi:CubicO group peptidase (beta-lactamase class C family)